MNGEARALRAAQFLFDPRAAAATLSACPQLAASQEPAREGVASAWFPGLRKSERQLYRLLGNTHYDHLAALLQVLDASLSRGFNQPRLLRTRAGSSFRPDLAELRAAEHFALVGCTIEGFDDSKGSHSVPDLLAVRDGFAVAVEVYCPLQYEHLDWFEEQLRVRIKNVDLPWDFVFHVELEKLREFDEQHRLLYLHEGELDSALAEEGTRFVAELVAELEERLDAAHPGGALAFAVDEPAMNLRIAVALEQIDYTQERLPDRAGVIGGPSTSGTRPEATFAAIASRAADKARDGQALQVEADAHVLIVDLSEARLTSELRSEVYRRLFVERLPPNGRHGHAAVAYVDSSGWGKPLIPWIVDYDEAAPAELFALLDPRGVLTR